MTTNLVKPQFEVAGFQIFRIGGKVWFRGSDIGRALGYADPHRDIRKLFDRNQSEFSAEMTRTVRLVDLGGHEVQDGGGMGCESAPQRATFGGHAAPQSGGFGGQPAPQMRERDEEMSMREVRIFSRRGLHLLAMFARTKLAQDFRVWALNVLDGECQALEDQVRLTLSQELALIGKGVSLMQKVSTAESEQVARALYRDLQVVNQRRGVPTVPYEVLAIAVRQKRLD